MFGADRCRSACPLLPRRVSSKDNLDNFNRFEKSTDTKSILALAKARVQRRCVCSQLWRSHPTHLSPQRSCIPSLPLPPLGAGVLMCRNTGRHRCVCCAC